MANETKPALMGVEKVARYMDLSVWTIRQWAYRGKLPSVKVGTRLMFKTQDIDDFIEVNMRPALKAAFPPKSAAA